MDYKIKNQYLELTVSSQGAEKRALKSSKVNYLRDVDQFWDRIAPFLFPNVGSLRDGYTIINNEKYYLNQHGFLRDQEFEVLNHKEDEISLVNVYNEKTLEKYPFKYKVIVTYQLIDKTLITQIDIHNEDDKDMIFNIGGHPGFRCPLYPDEKFEDYRLVFEKPESFSSPKVEKNATLNFYEPAAKFSKLQELRLKYDLFQNDAIVIPRIKSKFVKLVNDKNLGIKFDFQGFVSLGIWTKPNAPFICLEPWIGYADRFDTDHEFINKDNIITLPSLAVHTVKYKITIID
ncbi:MAG TPA: aldose 1-epimerase family protein [Acholeplasmataceae bacterium]|jgi:galactose mutarotase-like enzyme|nr:aldose 1-epimerase family protein [Acholeplasmataceae bacterium]